VKPSALPASAQIVRTADLTFPPVAMPPSMKPNAGQHSVAFIDASTGFLARGGQAFGTDAGGAYLPEAGIERTSDGGKTVDGLGGLGRLRQLDWISESRSPASPPAISSIPRQIQAREATSIGRPGFQRSKPPATV
jgi:hypothetical protein